MGLGGSTRTAAGRADPGSDPEPSPQQTAAPPPPVAQQREQQREQQQPFRILSEEILHKRYLTLYNRTVQFPAEDGGAEGPVLEYDIIGHPQADFHFAVVFPFHSADGGSVTLIREYAQGLNQLMWCLPTGGFDPRRHTSYEACARAEADEAPGRRDHEELTIEVVRVGLPELRRLMLSGDMLLPSVTTCFLALERLQEQGLLK
ncbi:hypothetical protein COHA_002720 [Chlorella ohadii]|uniref:Uncharacterized protein n=1 Tax=Chlorella ohadii TaxID=2649997 RepID=A0AAD5DUC9_9CHLO|nr:hypothetical protein COHA_002720 [Chlorella ohadii]